MVLSDLELFSIAFKKQIKHSTWLWSKAVQITGKLSCALIKLCPLLQGWNETEVLK